jgi:hypothetical protein
MISPWGQAPNNAPDLSNALEKDHPLFLRENQPD